MYESPPSPNWSLHWFPIIHWSQIKYKIKEIRSKENNMFRIEFSCLLIRSGWQGSWNWYLPFLCGLTHIDTNSMGIMNHTQSQFKRIFLWDAILSCISTKQNGFISIRCYYFVWFCPTPVSGALIPAMELIPRTPPFFRIQDPHRISHFVYPIFIYIYFREGRDFSFISHFDSECIMWESKYHRYGA